MASHAVDANPDWLRMVSGGRVFDLGRPLEPLMPVSPNHPGFRISIADEHLPAGAGHSLLPVDRTLLAAQGVHMP